MESVQMRTIRGLGEVPVENIGRVKPKRIKGLAEIIAGYTLMAAGVGIGIASLAFAGYNIFVNPAKGDLVDSLFKAEYIILFGAGMSLCGIAIKDDGYCAFHGIDLTEEENGYRGC